MTETEFRRRLAENNLALAPFRHRRMQQEHERRMAELRRKHQQEMEAIRLGAAQRRTDDERQRRADEDRRNEVIDSRLRTYGIVDVTHRRYGGTPAALGFDLAGQHLRRTIEGWPSAGIEEQRAHIAELCARYGIEARYSVRYFDSGAALRASSLLKLEAVVEVPPINTAYGYSTALHEIGHIAKPCDDSHVRVPTSGGRTCCIRCELNAWQFAREHARPQWTADMALNQRRALMTYRPYATNAEQIELDSVIATTI